MKKKIIYLHTILILGLFIIYSPAAISGPLDSWTLKTSGTSETLTDIMFNGSIYITVGTHGIILTSSNGTLWTATSCGIQDELTGIAYGNGKFVIVGDSTSIATSTNGSDWDLISYGGSIYIRDIKYAKDKFVAVGSGGTIVTSPDGEIWTTRNSNTSNTLSSITYGNNIFVAVGSGGTVVTSPDGETWTPRTSGTTIAFNAITCGNNIFIAVGWNGNIFTSINGEIWEGNYYGDLDLYDITYSNGIFVTVGFGELIATSSDGVTWESRTSGTSELLYGVTYANGTFWAVGNNGTILQSDPITTDIFPDISSNYWAYDYITSIYNAGITTGCVQDDPGTPENERRYCPEENVTREQMAAFIVRAVEGEPPLNYCDSGTLFSDVTSEMWSCKYIKRLKELGITTGYGDGRYGPYDLVPREQMAAFLVRAVEEEPPTNYCDSGSLFPDVTPNMWSCRYIKRLKELGITTGYGDGRYGPYDYVTRAQMAAFLSRGFLENSIVVKEYFPLQGGNTWRFNFGSYTLQITAVLTNFPPYITQNIFQWQGKINGAAAEGGYDFFNYDTSGNLLYYGCHFLTNNQFSKPTTPAVFLPSRIEIGQPYTTSYKDYYYDIPETESFGYEDKTETITAIGPVNVIVPAGTFSAYKVKREYTYTEYWPGGGTGSGWEELYLVKNIGPVQLVMDDGSVWRLESAYVNGINY